MLKSPRATDNAAALKTLALCQNQGLSQEPDAVLTWVSSICDIGGYASAPAPRKAGDRSGSNSDDPWVWLSVGREVKFDI